jgi:hypothetical protein
MPEDQFGSDPQLAELDFEGEPGQPSPAPAAAPAAEAPPVEEPDDDAFWDEVASRLSPAQMQALEQASVQQQPQQGPSDAEVWAQLEQLAEDDPFQAANVMAEIRVAQVEERMQQALAPLVQQHTAQQAVGTLEQLEQEFPGFSHEALAEVIARDPERFDVAPELQLERLRDVLELQALRGRRSYERGDDVIAGMEATLEQRDRLGVRRDSAGRFTSPQRPPDRVHVEGGSGPQPSMPASDVDPVIAEMDAVEPPRDAFGRRGRI